MVKNQLIYKYLTGFLSIVLLSGTMYAAVETLYYDDFDGVQSHELHGTLPDIGLSGGHAWIAHASWKADGTVGQVSSATLPFVPKAGYVYRLSATFRDVRGGDYWLGLGYTAGSSTASGGNGDRFIASPTSGSPWMLRRGNTSTMDDQLFLGPGASDSMDIAETLDRLQDVTFQMLLDTRNTQWYVTWKQKLASESDFHTIVCKTYSVNPVIAAVGVTNGQSTVTGRLREFRLEQVQTSLSIRDDGQPVGVDVYGSQPVTLEVLFNSSSPPTAVWHHVRDSQDRIVDGTDPDHTITLTETSPGQYVSTLHISRTDSTDEGYYYCILDNRDQFPIESQKALLQVTALVTHWPLGVETFTGEHYLDTESQRHATAAGDPLFTAGHRGTPGSAVEITPHAGWAQASGVPVAGGQTRTFSISLWCRWNGQWAQPASPGTLLMENVWGGTGYLANAIESGGQWYHICLTFDGTFGRTYLDGQLQSTQSWQLPEAGDVTVEIGHQAGEQTFNGALDDIRIYNYALADLQVRSLYSGEDCVLSYASEFDFSGPNGQPDCIVDIYDLMVFMESWLTCGRYPECH